MSKEEFDDILNEALNVIDRKLAELGMLPAERTTHAAIDFVKLCILEVRSADGKTSHDPSDIAGTLTSDWFSRIHKDVAAWYRRRYGARMESPSRDYIDGVILFFATPFALKIPTVVRTAGRPGETVWLQYPDCVLPDEDSVHWLENAPDLAAAPRGEAMKAKRFANEVAGSLRFVRTGIMGVETKAGLDQLLKGVLPNLELAAVKISEPKSDSLMRALWDIQMACEQALKALSNQRSGQFKETHDLFYLYDHMPDGQPGFRRSELSKLPNWEAMADLRYGGGPEVSIADAFRSYWAALKIISGTVDGLKRYRLGNARFEIGRPPWLSDE